jgi:hypothetical protein
VYLSRTFEHGIDLTEHINALKNNNIHEFITMKLDLTFLISLYLSSNEVTTTTAFSALKLQSQFASRPIHSTALASSKEPNTEVERLLARAAALRAEAATAEHQVHTGEFEKKKHQNKETDRRIDHLFFDGEQSVVDKLKSKRLSMDTLKCIIYRLHEREVNASGKEHIDPNIQQDRTDYLRVCDQVDEAELEKLEGLVGRLIEAVGVLDAELKAQKEATGKVHVNHIEDEHWGGLDSAKRLEQYYHEIHREHEDQFQKRQEEFREAQRVKEGNKAPPKQKDNMMHP